MQNFLLILEWTVDSIIHVEAKPKESDAWFSLTFFEGNELLDDKYDEPKHLGLFQLQLRLDDGIAVMNSIGPGASGEEERGDLHIDNKDEKVKIEIRVTKSKFKVFLNESLFAKFKHREDINKAKYVNVYGGFVVKKFVHVKK